MFKSKEIFSIRKFKNGKTEGAKIGALITLAAAAVVTASPVSANEVDNASKINPEITQAVSEFEKSVVDVKETNDKLIADYEKEVKEILDSNKAAKESYDKKVSDLEKLTKEYEAHIQEVNLENTRLQKDYEARLQAAKDKALKDHQTHVDTVNKENAELLKKYEEDKKATETKNAELKAQYDKEVEAAKGKGEVLNQSEIDKAVAENQKRTSDYNKELARYNERLKVWNATKDIPVLLEKGEYTIRGDVSTLRYGETFNASLYTDLNQYERIDAKKLNFHTKVSSGTGTSQDPYIIKNIGTTSSGKILDLKIVLETKGDVNVDTNTNDLRITVGSGESVKVIQEFIDSATGKPVKLLIPMLNMVDRDAINTLEILNGEFIGAVAPEDTKLNLLPNGYSTHFTTDGAALPYALSIINASKFVETLEVPGTGSANILSFDIKGAADFKEGAKEPKKLEDLKLVEVPAPVKNDLKVDTPKYLPEVQKPTLKTPNQAPDLTKITVAKPDLVKVTKEKPADVNSITKPVDKGVPGKPTLNETPKEVKLPALTQEALKELPQSALWNPSSDTVLKELGNAVTKEDILKVLKDLPNLNDLKIEVIGELPNGTQVGEFPIEIEITYPDGSKDRITVKSNIFETKVGDSLKQEELKAIPLSEVINAEGGEFSVEQGGKLTQEDLFKTIKGIPENTKAEFKVISELPSTDQPGTYDVKIKITYEDGSKEEVVIKVTVQEKKEEPKVEEPIKEEPKVEDNSFETTLNELNETPKQENTQTVSQESTVYETKETPDTGAGSIALAGLLLSSTSLAGLTLFKKKDEQ